MEQFEGSKAKLLRASKLIDEVDSILYDYNKNDPVSAYIDKTKNPPEIKVNYKGLSLQLGAVLGDTIHNLRASLDLLASDLVKMNGKSIRNVYFPFASSKEELDEMIIKKKFNFAGDKAVELLKSYLPYTGGNDQLRALHDLDIEDKHQKLIDTEKTMGIKLNFEYSIDDIENAKFVYSCDEVKHYFPNESKLAGKLVVETLKDIHKQLVLIVDSFEKMIKQK